MSAPPEVDPRPVVAGTGPDARVRGLRCVVCGYPTAARVPACPVCGGRIRTDLFGPRGRVFAATCLRVRVPGRRPGYAVAYVDLDDGPRILAHLRSDCFPEGIPGDCLPAVGSEVELVGVTEHGDPLAVVVPTPAATRSATPAAAGLAAGSAAGPVEGERR